MSLLTKYIFLFQILTLFCIFSIFMLQRSMYAMTSLPSLQIKKISSIWRWKCIRGSCQKTRITPETENISFSLSSCRLFCADYAGLWPKPTGNFEIGQHLVRLNIKDIEMIVEYDGYVNELFAIAERNFKNYLKELIPQNVGIPRGRKMTIFVTTYDYKTEKLTLDANESYMLFTDVQIKDVIDVYISAENFFGFRHAFETLKQLIVYDDVRQEIYMVKDIYITDNPAYPYRGILLDTSRNYISVETIKRTINTMAICKLNTFHWHITDSNSFPYLSKSYPELCQLGAYSLNKIYTKKDVANIVQYGKERGIRVIPEFDTPAHVGEGWQDTNFLVCFNYQPWYNYCSSPPCGQLDPTKSELYDLLEGIYKEMIELFDPDMFHMGGDEVNIPCWNSTQHIVNWMNTVKDWSRKEEDFIKLWNYFQTEARNRILKRTTNDILLVVWSSTMTKKKYVTQYLPKNDYIIQVWSGTWNKQLSYLLEEGYKVILSHYDVFYFDCGVSSWITKGNNWCSPYIGWQKVYDFIPGYVTEENKNQILGFEAALWTEQVADSAVDVRLWPRASALAERLWSNPEGNWKIAKERFSYHRDRLVQLGVAADTIEPEWCHIQEDGCIERDEFRVPWEL